MKSFTQNLWHKVKDSSSQNPVSQDPASRTHTAAQLAEHAFAYFYSPQHHQFEAKVKSHDTLGEQNHYGYVVWPVIIMVQATAECLPHKRLHEAISALQDHWNPEKHGFCAWKMFPGNLDIYYDDNAHAAQALISAYEVTHERKYLNQAEEILTGLIMPAAQKDGGVPWHISNPNVRNACSTGPTAVASLRICILEKSNRLTAFAERALNYIITTLRGPDDGLIWDGVVFEPDGTPKINRTKWTYNIGFAIHGFALLFECTKNPDHLNVAISLAKSVLNRDNILFDHSLPADSGRMYSDGSFFLHHLVDGFKALSRHAMKEELRDAICDIADWGREWMFDPTDGLYFRGSRPYTISEELTKKFNKQYNLEKSLDINKQERDEHGKLCKTMIGSASWARILCMEEQIKKGK
ncbi:Six-hairpin glycosidase-like protein [Xylogone sp. PMI_703]|nr:Six-hairpin glycosidase-like protein [Xylogone sp. PMI_703]